MMMKQTVTFAHVLKCYRRAAGLTQEQLAERAGLSARAISDLERGLKTRPHRDTVERLSVALGLTPAERANLEGVVVRPRRGLARASVDQPLPMETTPLIGREHDERCAARLLLTDAVRLLTLTGPGGVGKTRLAIRVAASV